MVWILCWVWKYTHNESHLGIFRERNGFHKCCLLDTHKMHTLVWGPPPPLKKHTRSYEVEHCVRIHIYKCQTHNQILHTNICTSYFINDFALFSYSSLLFATKNPLNYHNLFNSIFLMRSTFPTFNFDSCFSTLSIHKYFEIAYYIWLVSSDSFYTFFVSFRLYSKQFQSSFLFSPALQLSSCFSLSLSNFYGLFGLFCLRLCPPLSSICIYFNLDVFRIQFLWFLH